MKMVDTKPVAQTTLFDTCAPIEHYFQDLRARDGETVTPPITLAAEDAYLMHLVLGLHSQIHAVVDLAAAATWGATTLLWASQPARCRVITPALPSADAPAWSTV